MVKFRSSAQSLQRVDSEVLAEGELIAVMALSLSVNHNEVGDLVESEDGVVPGSRVVVDTLPGLGQEHPNPLRIRGPWPSIGGDDHQKGRVAERNECL